MDPVPPNAFTGMPRTLRRVVFFIMLLIGLWNFFVNVAARYKGHPFDDINGFPLWALNLMYVQVLELVGLCSISVRPLTFASTSTVWSACTIIYIGITWRYAKEHP